MFDKRFLALMQIFIKLMIADLLYNVSNSRLVDFEDFFAIWAYDLVHKFPHMYIKAFQRKIPRLSSPPRHSHPAAPSSTYSPPTSFAHSNPPQPAYYSFNGTVPLTQSLVELQGRDRLRVQVHGVHQMNSINPPIVRKQNIFQADGIPAREL